MRMYGVTYPTDVSGGSELLHNVIHKNMQPVMEENKQWIDWASDLLSGEIKI